MTNTWIRFFIETFLEFAISCLVGIKLLYVISGDSNKLDQVSHICAIVFLVVLGIFSVMIVYLSLVKGRELKKIKKELVKQRAQELPSYQEEIQSLRSSALG